MVRSTRRRIGIAALFTAVLLSAIGLTGAASAAPAQEVSERPASIALPIKLTPNFSGSAVGFLGFATMAEVSVWSNWARPTGTVTIKQGGWVVARAKVQPDPENPKVSTVRMYGLHIPDNHELTATYSGDDVFDGASFTTRIWY